VVYEVGN